VVVSRRRIDVRIDELVLRGVAPGDRDGIASGLQSELRRLLTEDAAQGGFVQERSTTALSLGEFHVGPSEPADRLGGHLARHVARGMRR
jgi:hypothetical protein